VTAETAKKFQALEAQAQTLMGVFIKAGYEAVSPAIIQPANVFLDVIGETLRARTYVFTDPDGEELCLRPDLTVPTCRLHMERHGASSAVGKYCYNGPAFRFQPAGSDAAHPREFRQAGIESFGIGDREKAEAQTVALIIDALKAAGLKDFQLRIGDLGLFRAVMEAADMPERWRQRLNHHFWRPDAFRAELKRISTPEKNTLQHIPPALLADLDPKDPARSEQQALAYFEENKVDIIGDRSVREVVQNLLSLVADAKSEPLPAKTAALIESYLEIEAPARAAGARLRDLARDKGIDIAAALDSYHRRLKLLAEYKVDAGHAEFSAEFGRTLEYYTGFVFEIVVPHLGTNSPIAGGGRYDDLMEAVGSEQEVPAVGAAIHTERLLATIAEGQS
jgi:ATP phosphoribosyltransferase regulatory subunit